MKPGIYYHKETLELIEFYVFYMNCGQAYFNNYIGHGTFPLLYIRKNFKYLGEV